MMQIYISKVTGEASVFSSRRYWHFSKSVKILGADWG
jgi:hypothetical protein